MGGSLLYVGAYSVPTSIGVSECVTVQFDDTRNKLVT